MDEPFKLRKPCFECGSETGIIRTRNGQDCAYCSVCDKYQKYNVPKTESGRKPRTVSNVHSAIKPKQRARILLRATGKCELCGYRPDDPTRCLHVGHIISVNVGMAQGLTDRELNDDENLMALCDECNLGLGQEVIPLRLAVAIVLARLRPPPPAMQPEPKPELFTDF
jgi:hypothetical protein